MMTTQREQITAGRKPVPRGIARTGPALLSYGFRPFFLLSGVFAVLSMTLWIGALTLGWNIGDDYGALNWHAHEMLFGYASAALAGFLLTAVPNWTGRLPVSGLPLLAIVAVWIAGRVVMAVPQLLGLPTSMVVDGVFLPTLAAIAAREIIAGRNWKNLKILAGLTALSLANIAFHVSVALDGSASQVVRPAVGVYVLLIALVGGRIVPSFSRNWLVKAGSSALPRPFGTFDVVSLVALLVALVFWSLWPEGPATAALALLAAILQASRLWSWQGRRTIEEPMLFVLHVGYGFISLGLFAVALAALGWMAQPSVLHVLTVGAIGNMTLAVMTRVSLGHTGRSVSASLATALAYLALLLAAILRPFAELVPEQYHLLLSLSGGLWVLGFGVFVVEYGPMLVTRNPKQRR